MATAIKVENLSKAYRLGLISTGTLASDIQRWYALARGKEDPLQKISETNDRTVKGTSDVVWSLKDINFEIEQGDIVGIIGKNGAGKSTLLKILSRVTGPTTGKITGNGRVASLLEVGTGFHPELTGKDNIYLNGAILGMRKKEIKHKFDDIVDFAGVERYIDTPVKRYSSGMYVRLAFAVAAYLESEILIVDEVLSVGDAEFQKKCLGKMKDISKGEGRTVLFVSHSMESVLRICKSVMLLKNGNLINYGSSEKVISSYLTSETLMGSAVIYEQQDAPGDDTIILLESKAISLDRGNQSNFFIDEKVGIKIKFEIKKSTNDVVLGLNLFNQREVHILSSHEHNPVKSYDPGIYTTIVWFPKNFLAEGLHYCGIAAMGYNPFTVRFHDIKKFSFNINDRQNAFTARGEYAGEFPGIIRPILEWENIINY